MALCPSCGNDSAASTGDCAACGRSLTPSFILSTLAEGQEEVEYEFDEWDAHSRADATAALVGTAVPYRWEPGLLLVVAADREADVDRLLDEVEDQGVDALEAGQVTDSGALAPAADEWGEGEESFGALGDLYDAADRLFHWPADRGAKAELGRSSQAVAAAPPPFGFNPVLWQTAGTLGRQLMDLIDGGASDDDIRAGAEALRDVLADHI